MSRQTSTGRCSLGTEAAARGAAEVIWGTAGVGLLPRSGEIVSCQSSRSDISSSSDRGCPFARPPDEATAAVPPDAAPPLTGSADAGRVACGCSDEATLEGNSVGGGGWEQGMSGQSMVDVSNRKEMSSERAGCRQAGRQAAEAAGSRCRQAASD